MVQSIKRVSVFLSSPSDVEEEREACARAVRQVEALRGMKDGFSIQLLRWESSTSPALGQPAQAIINKQIGDSYDIFVGVICARFGTPTEEWQSGTEEEFRLAYARLKGGENVQILLYFIDPKLSSRDIDGEQLVKVQKFKADAESLGLISNVRETHGLESRVMKDISRSVDEVLKVELAEGRPTPRDKSGDQSTSDSRETLINDDGTIDEDEYQAGLLDLQILMEDKMADVSGLTDEISKAQLTLNGKISSATRNLDLLSKDSATGAPPARKAKKIVDGVSNEIIVYASTVERATPKMKESFYESLAALNEMIILVPKELSASNEAGELRDILSNLKNNIHMVRGELEKFTVVILGLPGMTAEFRRGQKRAKRAFGHLDAFFSDAIDQLTEATTSLESRFVLR